MPRTEDLSIWPRTPSSRAPRRKPSNLSPIPSVASDTSIWARNSNGYLLQSTPKSFSFDDPEQSLSSIDLESLVLFPEMPLDLELRIPSSTIVPQHVSIFIEDLPARPETSLSRASMFTEKYHNVLHQVRRGLSTAKSSSQAMCGKKEAQYDSDSDHEADSFGRKDRKRISSSVTQHATGRHSATPQTAISPSTYSTDSPNLAATSHKRRAIYGGKGASKPTPLTMPIPDPRRQSYGYASLHLAPSDVSNSSPCSDYRRRRRSAFAILG